MNVYESGIYNGSTPAKVEDLQVRSLSSAALGRTWRSSTFFILSLLVLSLQSVAQTATFTITPEMLEFTRLDGQRGLEAGRYHVRVGTSSGKYGTGTFKLELR